MKHIFKTMLLPALVLPLMLVSCDDDRDSNPTLDVSHASDGFVLNVPSNAANNTYDLASATSLELTCSQPNYGGVPYVTRYYVQVSIDPAFLTDPANTPYKELTTYYTTAKMEVSAEELNDSIVQLYKDANPDLNYPTATRPVYIRLRALLDNTLNGESYSNIITLPSVLASYVAPPATLADQLYICGSSIQNAWADWKVVAPVYGLEGKYYTMAYFTAGAQFYWGTKNNDNRGYSRLVSVSDNAGAGLSAGDDDKITVANAGWYVLYFTGEIVDNATQYTLSFETATAYVIGNPAGGSWTDADAAWKMTAPDNASGEWVSPAFTASGELRAYIKVPGLDWWRTEFTLYQGSLYFRDCDIPDNWASNVGSSYSVTCSAGQKLYVNFDMNTGEVK